MSKILTNNVETVVLSGAVEHVVLPINYKWVWVRNDGGATFYISKTSNVGDKAHGTIPVMSSDSARLYINGTDFYITGSGSALVYATDTENCPFKSAPTADGGVQASGTPIQMDGLQGGVPFSEVAVRMKGKNLFWGSLIVGMISTSDGKLVTTTKNYLSTKDFIEVTPNTVYTLSNTEGISYHAVFFYDNDKQFIGYFINPDYEYISFTTPANCRYIKWRYHFETTDATVDMITNIQLEQGDTATEYVPPVTGHELTVNANGVDYTIIPDSNPYIVPTEIYQQSGNNTLSVSGEGEPTLSVTGIRKNAAVRRIWDKLNELTTAIIVSNGEI